MKKIIYASLAFAPILTFAAGTTNLVDLTSMATAIRGIIAILIPAGFGLAVLFFFYGVAVYILSAGDAAKAKEGKSIMIYGVIAIAVIASVWGLVAFLQSTFGVSATTSQTIPTVTGLE